MTGRSPATHPSVLAAAARHPAPLLFLTISGAHLYGFPSPDSDVDLRGVHVLPAEELLGLGRPRATIELSGVEGGVELDLVTHDAKKFFSLLLSPNGYVLEQLWSPLVVLTRPEHAELREIAKGCVTRGHVRHYLGFAATQWRLHEQEHPGRLKPLLYVYRVLLTGIRLMRTGEVEADLARLAEDSGVPFLQDLIARKRQGPEDVTLDERDAARHDQEYGRLRAALEHAVASSPLPEAPSGALALNDLLLRLRRAGATR
jgi:hypothetical protein